MASIDLESVAALPNSWKVVGASGLATDLLGVSVAADGDLDGDGVEDLVFGAPWELLPYVDNGSYVGPGGAVVLSGAHLASADAPDGVEDGVVHLDSLGIAHRGGDRPAPSIVEEYDDHVVVMHVPRTWSRTYGLRFDQLAHVFLAEYEDVFDYLMFVAQDGQWTGEFDDDGDRIFTASTTETLSVEDIVEEYGVRVPSHEDSQKEFRAAVVLIVDEDNPQTDAVLGQLGEEARRFSNPGADEHDDINFWEATGGRASITMGDLSGARRPESLVARRTGAPSSGSDGMSTSERRRVVEAHKLLCPERRPHIHRFGDGTSALVVPVHGESDSREWERGTTRQPARGRGSNANIKNGL